jgi:hypothetical protein
MGISVSFASRNGTRSAESLKGRPAGWIKLIESDAWSLDVNSNQRKVDGQMKIDNVRCKLKSV